MSKKRRPFAGFLSSLKQRGIDDATWDELEDALILADAGVSSTTDLLERLKKQARAEKVRDADALVALLKRQIAEDLGADGADQDGQDDDAGAVSADIDSADIDSADIDSAGPGDAGLCVDGQPAVWLFVGVNGVGKTTTIGKLAALYTQKGHKVVLAAGDTFRAAAVEQLGMWAERSGAELTRGAEGADPSSVVFDSIQHAAAVGADLVMADTAGRLHNRTNLMEELAKIRRVAGKASGKVTEVLLVIDASTGQNGLAQAHQFTQTAEVTGLVLTKLDGSAKGGIVLAINHELDIPIKLVGLGESITDLAEFSPQAFAEGLLG